MPAEKIPAVDISRKARDAARQKVAAARKERLARRQGKYQETILRLRRLRGLIERNTKAAAKAQKDLGPAIRTAIKKTAAAGADDAKDKPPIAAVDAAERPLRLVLKTRDEIPRKKLHALIAATLGLTRDKKAFTLDPLFPKARKKHRKLALYWVAELAADRRSTAAIQSRIADALRRTGAFSSVRAEALRMGLFSGGGTGPGYEMDVPKNRDWHLTSPDPNSPYWHDYHGGIDVYGAWEALGVGPNGEDAGSGFTIGHPDTGFREHSDYPTNRIDLANAYNAFSDRVTPDNADPVTQNVARHGVMPRGFPYYEMHGTFTASVIVAPCTTDFSRPVRSIVGVAQGATMLPLRCVTTVILAGDIEIIAAIEHAIQEDVDVISISLGGAPNPVLRDALAAAVDQGIIVVAAAGQSEGAPIPQAVAAPACYPEVIAVGGSIGPLPWEGCFHGPEVDICAPAVHIRHATFEVNGDDGWKTSQGTSFATAITAGLATLWLQAHGGRQAIEQAVPDVPVQQVFRHMLKQTAVDTTIFADDPPPGGWNTRLFGAGLVNAKALVINSLPPPEDVPPFDEAPPFNVYGAASGIAILDVGEPWSLAAVNWLFTSIGQAGEFAQTGAELAGDMWSEFAADPLASVTEFVASLGTLAELFDAALAAEMAQEAWEDTMAAAGSVAGELGEMLGDAAEAAGEAWEEAEDAVDEALDNAGDAVDEFIDDTGSFIEDTAETASETAGEVAGAIADTFGGIFG
ncbi:S8 family peptidase [Hwanghaeella sp.]|uniref:S8 family peptidase n=1 Tax=Hwanghaeella sp. TaxID=2605943 RepID=UPI003CCC2946